MNGLVLLASAAAGIGVVHALLGPDHYLPFIVLARARGWSALRTLAITAACGSAHVLSSLALAAVGIAVGLTATRLAHLESVRGSLAAWALIAGGAVYAAYGLHRALRGDRHVHLHPHPVAHDHRHDPHHSHAHADGSAASAMTPWWLFIVFVLGPCEPLIPLLMAPAAAGNVAGTALVALSFAVATLAAMLATVMVGRAGARLLPLGPLERFSHALAGGAILLSGLGIVLLGW